MNLLEILEVKPDNNLPIAYGSMKFVPAFLHKDERTTQELNQLVYEYFPYDLVRIGQMHGWADNARYTNSNRCLQLVLDVDYDHGHVKARLATSEEDLARGSSVFKPWDTTDEIEDHRHQLLANIKKSLAILKENLMCRMEEESKKRVEMKERLTTLMNKDEIVQKDA